MTPADYLREALRPVAAGEERIQDCSSNLIATQGYGVFLVQVGDRLYKIRATSLERVQMIAYTPDAGAEVSCGRARYRTT